MNHEIPLPPLGRASLYLALASYSPNDAEVDATRDLMGRFAGSPQRVSLTVEEMRLIDRALVASFHNTNAVVSRECQVLHAVIAPLLPKDVCTHG